MITKPRGRTVHVTNRSPAPRFSVLLDNIRSAWNVGSILRSAEGLGFENAYLCGITPGPENSRVRKTALGAERSINCSLHKDSMILVEHLGAEGNIVLALETGGRANPLSTVNLEFAAGQRIVLVVGNEVTGIDPGLIEAAHQVTYIPMLGKKQSLNVAVAFGIAAYFLSILPFARDVNHLVNGEGGTGHQ